MEAEEALRAAALQEAARHGSAQPKSVLGKVLGAHAGLRPQARELGAVVARIVAEVNALSPAEVVAQAPAPEPRKATGSGRSGLPPLETDGPVVLRFAPGPSGPLHLGHSRAVALNSAYRGLHNGKLILRLEDTNPAAVDPVAYGLIAADMEWLGATPDETVVQSDRLEIYCGDARELLSRDAAYVCHCDAEKWRELKRHNTACPCRGGKPAAQLVAFEALLSGGDGIIVVKTDLEDRNPALRDFVAMRVVETPHPRQGDTWRLWPTYNFAVAVDDYRLGVTHVLRGKDHLNNTLRQQWVYRHLGWDEPRFIHYGLVSIPDALLKTTTIRGGIASSEYSGWDDPQLATLVALRRRGYQPQAIMDYWVTVGVKEVDITLSWQNLEAANRALVEPEARRLFWVPEPFELTLDAPQPLEKHAPFHPDRAEMGERRETVEPGATIVLPAADVAQLAEGDLLRLKNLCNCRLRDGRLEHAGDDPVKGVPIVQWCAAGAPLQLLRPNGSQTDGIVEPAAAEMEGEVVQFERVGFVRLERSQALFLHR
ncbi:MAG: glutamate--tRNA ligase [Candidatus Poseidoniia archaeon]|nr:glutamate--tRNA ligase [Candidatus Poseidoniia archaeon]